MSEAAHSYWSASNFEADRLCPGRKVLCEGLPDNTNEHAASGTASHQLLTWALQDKCDAARWLGTTISLNAQGRVLGEGSEEPVVYAYKVDRERAERVQVAIDYVHQVMALDPAAVLLVDRKVNYARWLGVDYERAWGTLDIAIVLPTLRTLYAPDFKDGRGYVPVGNDEDGPNDQVALYGLGQLDDPTVDYDIDEVVLGIIQPRISEEVSEYRIGIAALTAWAENVARPTVRTIQVATSTYRPDGDAVVRLEWEETFLKPNDKSCAFCRTKATCPALRDQVAGQVFEVLPSSPDDFETVTASDALVILDQHKGDDGATWIGAALSKVDMIEDWCKAVRAEAERRMLAGQDVPGYKLVQGKQGDRAWSNAEEAEKMLKAMRLKDADMYDFKLISPTSAEKLAPKYDKDGKVKPTKAGTPEPLIGPRQWPKLQALITRKPGKPHVAPISDGRAPLKLAPAAEDFEVIDTELKVFGGALGGGMSDLGQQFSQQTKPDAQAVTTFDPNDFA